MNFTFEVTVIIPIFNAANYIVNAVESALQFDEVKEILLIEDASTDNSLSVCQKLQNTYKRVRLFQHPDKKNHGAGESRNLGLKKSEFPFIAFLDADDFFLSNRFDSEKILFKQNPDVDGVYNAIGVHYYSEDAEKMFRKANIPEITTVKKKLNPDLLFPALISITKDYGYFSLDGLTFKKNILSKMTYWFNPDLRLHQDTEFIIRLSYYAKLFPGEIIVPVAKRGVHMNNRITQIRSDLTKRKLHRTKLNDSLYNWAKDENLKSIYLKQIRRMRIITNILKYNRFFIWLTSILNAIRKPGSGTQD